MNHATRLPCTLITPLKNELDNVHRIWDAILSQSRPPDEWLITDNGSSDGTYEWLLENAKHASFPVRILSMPGKTIAEMMNTATREAKCDIIACCHGGTSIPVEWLENLLEPFNKDSTVDVSAGVWRAYGETPFEKWVIDNGYAKPAEPDEKTYLPASRSLAYKRSAWEKAEGFPEWLPKFGEDLLFAMRLRACGVKIALAQNAVVGWRPKSSIWRMMKQHFWYLEANACMGFANSGVLFRFWSFLIIGFIVGFFSRWWLGISVFLFSLLADYARRVLFGYQRNDWKWYLFWRVAIPIAEQAGYIKGTSLRLLHLVKIPSTDLKIVREYKQNIKKHR